MFYWKAKRLSRNTALNSECKNLEERVYSTPWGTAVKYVIMPEANQRGPLKILNSE
jgi:hypothetical protein